METETNFWPHVKKLLYSNTGLAFLLIVLIVTIIFSTKREEFILQSNNWEFSKVATELSASPLSFSLDKSEPIKLRLPTLNQVIDFSKPLGLNEDKTIEVPSDYISVGWYKYSKTPGEIGPAIVLGHVDSYEGPAVFFRLKELVVGDDIYVDRADGSTAHFKVDAVETYKQAEFPTAVVYGETNYSALRLITCTGVYNHGTLEYSHNLVVFASLIEPLSDLTD